MPKLSKDKDLPTAITQLRLCSALKYCGHIKFADAFDKSDEENLYVYDNENLGYTDWDNVEPADFISKTFNAQNPNKNTLVLLPLDGYIITGNNIIQGGVCDCALLTDKEMSYIEFKTNVSSSSNYKTILQRADEAETQLWHTYNDIIQPKCKKKGVNINQKVSLDFNIVFNQDLNVTNVQASLLDIQLDFLINNNYPLYFRNSKQFE